MALSDRPARVPAPMTPTRRRGSWASSVATLLDASGITTLFPATRAAGLQVVSPTPTRAAGCCQRHRRRLQ